ncbi:sugar ABC transporter ATP-binding protein [Glaciimonas sp. PCH181]|uniref:sugar ABC transporter ATP-binding protein n=1 Tax=Glaciimonas sp. PCH181 TaxID=2133943 RepID=UPI000D39A243|nr:sugar ABC transporter ATP-binding protein [Glaciimonas sp. PCH181]PUA19711.1 sugar ABC transporter ATP-binding protein [Glaciimonas sp. PCH181]
MNAPIEIVRLEDVTKLFGTVQALKQGAITLRTGEVHALVGVNGAGKSTLARIISGHIRRSAGSYAYKGAQVDFGSPREAMRGGISLVMQETSIAPDLNVMENLCLPDFGQRERLDWRAMKRKAIQVLEDLGQAEHLPLQQRAGDLSMAQRQIIEIGRALQQDSELIIFDEPTASFSPPEVDRLFAIMRLLRERGKAMVFVSHRLEEIFDITDRITVMREGRTVASDLVTAEITPNELIQRMVGREIGNLYDRNEARVGALQLSFAADHAVPEKKILLEVRNLRSGKAVRDVSFSVRAGEIVGLAGLVGAGRSETLETIFGLRPMDGGSIHYLGQPVRFRTPAQATRQGIGMIGEDRRRQGIIPDFTVQENLLLAHLGADKSPGLGYRQHAARISQLLDELDMPEHILIAPMLGLSGGQQQKVILARWLLLEPRLLLLDEPTRGVDIGTRNTLYQIIRKIAASGIGVVVVSSDFEEVLGISDRIVVLSDGVSVAEADADLLNPEVLTMFSTPRSSAQGIRKVLQAMAHLCGGSACWMQIEEGRVYCFDLVDADKGDPGFSSKHFPSIAQTAIPTALACAGSENMTGIFTQDGSLRSTFFALSNQGGHSFGYLGVTLPVVSASTKASPDAAQLRHIIIDTMDRNDIGQLHIAALNKDVTT